MSAARDAILNRLRTARATARLPRGEHLDELPLVSHTREESLARFGEEAVALGIEYFVEPSVDALRARVAALLTGERILSWDADQLPYSVGDLVGNALHGSAPRDEQALATIGVTGCDAAIAETGSLVILSAPGRSRTISLLPPVHLAIVRPDQMCFSMGEFFARDHARVAASTSCTFITGPSRTADIELTLTLGIHGPGRVIVILGP